jgi:hypothetical protein
MQQVLFWVWLGLVLKLPVIGLCWFLYKVANDTPDQVVGDGDDGGSAVYAQGPRSRGPHDGPPRHPRSARRGDSGHQEAVREKRPDHALRGE